MSSMFFKHVLFCSLRSSTSNRNRSRSLPLNFPRGASCGPRSSCSLNWRREFRSLVPTSKNCRQRPFVQLSLRQQVLGFTTRLVGCTPWKVERHSVLRTKTVNGYKRINRQAQPNNRIKDRPQSLIQPQAIPRTQRSDLRKTNYRHRPTPNKHPPQTHRHPPADQLSGRPCR